jgi:hypothetical protein
MNLLPFRRDLRRIARNNLRDPAIHADVARDTRVLPAVRLLRRAELPSILSQMRMVKIWRGMAYRG